MEQPHVASLVGLLGHVAVAQDLRDGGVVGVKQAQASRLVAGHGYLRTFVCPLYVHVRKALCRERPRDAVHVYGDYVVFHALAMQVAGFAPIEPVQAAQRPLACADKGACAAGGVH